MNFLGVRSDHLSEIRSESYGKIINWFPFWSFEVKAIASFEWVASFSWLSCPYKLKGMSFSLRDDRIRNGVPSIMFVPLFSVQNSTFLDFLYHTEFLLAVDSFWKFFVLNPSSLGPSIREGKLCNLMIKIYFEASIIFLVELVSHIFPIFTAFLMNSWKVGGKF